MANKIRKNQTQELVPYTGADQAIDLGSQNITTTGTITATTLVGAGSGGGSWGSITGTLSTQTDLQSALDLKSDISTIAELSQDAVGTILTDSSSIDFTYTDATPAITAVVAAGGVTNTMLAGSIAASKLVGTDIATVGTLTAGTIGSGFTTISVARGGTGVTSFTDNRLLVGNNVTSISTLALGTANRMLGMNSGATANEYKTLSIGSTGTTPAIVHGSGTVAFNFPLMDAASVTSGLLSNTTQTIPGAKTFSTTPISSGGTPTNATDLVIKSYVDAIANTINPALYKNACTCATTANITLSGEQTIDTFATSATRVLVKNQSTSSQNGIYISDSGAWTRASDYNTAAEVAQGTSTFILDGSVNINKLYVMNEATVTTLGTDPITFTAISALSSYNFFSGTSGTDFAVDISGNNITYNNPVATASVSGKLSSTDWTTFNAKAGVSGATVNLNLARFTDTVGTVSDSGIQLSSSGADRTMRLSTAGAFTIMSGSAGNFGTAYDLNLTAMGVALPAGSPGAVNITGGSTSGTASTANGGNVNITGGQTNPSIGNGGTGGSVVITGGLNDNFSKTGGVITVTGGSTTVNGNITMDAYTITIDSTDPLKLNAAGTGWYALLDCSLVEDSNKTFTFPNASGTFAVSASDGIALDATTGNLTLSGASLATDIQVFTSSGTWTKPSGSPKTTTIIAIGGGGGGGSGRKGAVATVRTGGAGGGAGGFATGTLQTSVLASTVAVTVGTGGAGGASVTTDNTSGSAGSVGSATSFGTWLRAGVGSAGNGGSTAAATGGTGGYIFPSGVVGSAGGASSGSGSAGSSGTQSNFAPAGGASGGGITTGNVANSGGTGGQVSGISNGNFSGYGATLSGGAGGGASTSGSVGTASPASSGIGGAGGGGGGASITTNAGAGGNGGLYGGGGGGGGAALNAVGNSGAGGTGGNGILIAITHY